MEKGYDLEKDIKCPFCDGEGKYKGESVVGSRYTCDDCKKEFGY